MAESVRKRLRKASLISHSVAIAPGVGPGDAVMADGIEEHGRGTACNAELLYTFDVVATRFELLENRIRNGCLDVHFVEPRRVRPERSEEVQRLHAGPFKGLVEVRIPVRPELDDIEECLEYRLVLVVAPGRAERHQRLPVLQNDARCERVARARPRPELRGPRWVQPELLAANAHADSG